jgi:hypothetical protein
MRVCVHVHFIGRNSCRLGCRCYTAYSGAACSKGHQGCTPSGATWGMLRRTTVFVFLDAGCPCSEWLLAYVPLLHVDATAYEAVLALPNGKSNDILPAQCVLQPAPSTSSSVCCVCNSYGYCIHIAFGIVDGVEHPEAWESCRSIVGLPFFLDLHESGVPV